ncbi:MULTISPECIES: hypothetical protein [Paenibacillus]|uniref:hypothetical protein n=1 Tax=Paenibacillus TaxID=44249 RepID=UPI0002D34E92|nr:MULTISPECIES: hypothetical protein [Paenibacillus]URJ63722.3 hypothetical protein MF620_003320 [Paenibacillus polymyxa]
MVTDIIVAPYVGAWIETSYLLPFLLESMVAPYMGAYIETSQNWRLVTLWT